MKNIESHPLQPFIFLNSEILMLGSFPPKKERWSMEFYYPNFQNDMWRIFGLIFFDNKEHFLNEDKKSFNKTGIVNFLIDKKIAFSDTAHSIIRHKDNASDNFLEIVEKADVQAMFRQMPFCRAVVTTGQKASETLASGFDVPVPKIGSFTEFGFEKRIIHFYRMPSSSRAYPLALDKKAALYKSMFEQSGLL